MRVGIVTVHDSSNLGSYLQALAMIELVRSNGDEPVILRTRSELTTFLLYMGYNNSKSVRSLKSFLRFLLQAAKHPGTESSAYKKYLRYKEDRAKLGRVVDAAAADNIDVLLLGSDEIWNLNQPAFRNPLLYGEGIRAKKKYGYAVSIGNMDMNAWEKHPGLRSAVLKLDGVYVRDKRTYNFLSGNGIEPMGPIADPTLQTDITGYMKSDSEVALPSEKYIAVYSYGVPKEKREIIKRFAREHGLKTAAVSLPNSWCDEYLNCSPLEFGAVLRNAEYVYTSTFHGTIFALLYHKNVVIESVRPKVGEVAELLGAEEWLLPDNYSYEYFNSHLAAERDYSVTDQKICSIRTTSRDIYRTVVKG